MIGRQLAGRGVVAGGIGVLCLAVGGLGVATAANGGSLILGHHNTATKTTSLKDRHGTPLSLVGKKSKPPLKVNSSKQVKHLNASLLGGESASTLSHTITYTAGTAGDTFTGTVAYRVNIRAGLYDISFQSIIGPGDGSSTAPSQNQCALVSDTDMAVYVSNSAVYIGGGGFPLLSGDNVMKVPSGGLIFFCQTTATDPSTVLVPNTISFTTVNSQTRRVAPMTTGPLLRGQGALR